MSNVSATHVPARLDAPGRPPLLGGAQGPVLGRFVRTRRRIHDVADGAVNAVHAVATAELPVARETPAPLLHHVFVVRGLQAWEQGESTEGVPGAGSAESGELGQSPSWFSSKLAPPRNLPDGLVRTSVTHCGCSFFALAGRR